MHGKRKWRNDYRRVLSLQTELLDERAVCALVCGFQILQVLAAVGYKTQKAAARVLVLVIFIEMDGKFLYSTGQKRDLHLRRAGVSIMKAGFSRLVLLFSLR